MKKILFLSMFTILASSAVFAQLAPPGAGDRNLNDNNIKMRSVELDRAKRQDVQIEADSYAPINTKLTVKFPQIKEDFEGIQLLQDAIINAYTKGKTVNYAAIVSSADQINSKGKRLDSNLFADTKKDKDEKLTPKEAEKPATVRDLIIDLDNAIGKFVASKIFSNPQVIEPQEAISTRDNLLAVIKLSEKLSIESKKQIK